MKAWNSEILTLAMLLPVLLIIGFSTGYTVELLLLTTVTILARQVYQINRLERMLRQGRVSRLPETKGIWEDIYYHLYRMKKADKRRKKKLSKMVDQFRKSTAALPDAAVVLGENDEIEWTNKTARDVLGLKKGDKGQRLPNLLRSPAFIEYLHCEDPAGSSVIIQSPVIDGMMLELKVVPYGTGLRLLLAHDVTEMKNMERMRKDFVANVSHELRTPLTVLKGYLETVQDVDSMDAQQLRNVIAEMLAQAERMQHMVDDLLLLARLESRQQKKGRCVHVPELLEQLCRDASLLEADPARIQLSVASKVNIYGNEQELRSAFNNLLINALKYSPREAPVQVNWYERDGAMYLDVEDQGIGIAAADISRITERFYRVDINRSRKLSGTGLGLAIVKHVLVRHDAELKIDSELGKGSRFRCIFPPHRVC